MSFELPPRSSVGYLDPEIANEGQKVILSDGDIVGWTPPPVKPVMPDWSQIKSIRHLFGRTGHSAWPAWLYHPSEQPRIVKNQEEANALGVCFRKATDTERGRYGVTNVWDNTDSESKWRSTPYERDLRFDPKKLGQGKTFYADAPNPAIAQNELVRMLIPEVAAAVAQALKSGGPSAPARIDAKEWEQFLAFKAYQKTVETVDAMAEKELQNPLAASGDDKTIWIEEAERRGVKVDGRWSLEKIKAEVEKAA